MTVICASWERDSAMFRAESIKLVLYAFASSCSSSCAAKIAHAVGLPLVVRLPSFGLVLSLPVKITCSSSSLPSSAWIDSGTVPNSARVSTNLLVALASLMRPN